MIAINLTSIVRFAPSDFVPYSDRFILRSKKCSALSLWVLILLTLYSTQAIIVPHQTSCVAAGFGRHGVPPPVCNPDL